MPRQDGSGGASSYTMRIDRGLTEPAGEAGSGASSVT